MIVDPKRISIKTLKTVESIDNRLAAIETMQRQIMAAFGVTPSGDAIPAADMMDETDTEAKADNEAAAVSAKGNRRG